MASFLKKKKIEKVETKTSETKENAPKDINLPVIKGIIYNWKKQILSLQNSKQLEIIRPNKNPEPEV